jgi:cytochrome c peroxidase
VGAFLKVRFIVPLVLALASPAASLADEAVPDAVKETYRRPLTIPFAGATPYSPQLATIGKMLYFDPRLSGAQNMSCASCHNPSFGWEVPVPGAVGAQNTPLARQAPTVLNAAWMEHLFWDGRAASLEEQAAGPITAAAEMNGNFDEIVERLSDVPEYKRWFETLFPGKGISPETITTAIATYERTIVVGWSPFDRWIEGDENAISESAKRGFALFVGDAGCASCHSGWNFTDNQFHDIGLYGDDLGRAVIDPGDPMAEYAFKTPGLRNVMYRAPFMHDGSLPDMATVIAHYEGGGISRPSLSPLMRPVRLDDRERGDLIAFLTALTADQADVPTPILPTR